HRRLYFDPATLERAGYPVHQGVLHERLQQQLRNRRGVSLRRDLPAHLEPLAKAHLLQVQIRLEEIQLLPERDEIGAAVLEHGAQQRRERAQHTLRRHAVGLDESRYSLQGVEQEMRVQLRAQRLQLALREALPQLQALDLLVLFSSRRRHTMLQGDWSSDVCSSNLPNLTRPVQAVNRSPSRVNGRSSDDI